MVIGDGRIVEEGRHEELLKCDGEYCRLYELQFAQVKIESDAGSDITSQDDPSDEPNKP